MNVTAITLITRSHELSLDKTLNRLKTSKMVDGLALFGAQTVNPDNPISDYDLLILVRNPPILIFQMLTHIDGRMADVVFVETDTVDTLLTLDEPVTATSIEGMLMLKIHQAQIVYDASGRLERVRQYTLNRIQSNRWLLPSPANSLYGAWFWQNHLLFHVKRMVQSKDPVYLTAVDMMLLSGVSDLCRIYYQVHNLPWQGEKDAVRYLQTDDPYYLNLLRACLAETNRVRKVSLYEELVTQTLAPIGALWTPGITAVYLRDASLHPVQVSEALLFWESLLSE